MIANMILEFHDTELPEEEEFEKFPLLGNDIVKAICIIQNNERGRQGIERAILFKRKIKEEEKKIEKQKLIQEGTESLDENE